MIVLTTLNVGRVSQVREAQLEQWNYILVVGKEEQEARTVNVRTRDNVVHGMFRLEDVVAILKVRLRSNVHACEALKEHALCCCLVCRARYVPTGGGARRPQGAADVISFKFCEFAL